MNTMKTLAAAGLVLAGVHGPAEAGYFMDGNTLVKDMRASEQAGGRHVGHYYGVGAYTGFIVGVADVYAAISWCPNSEVTLGQTTGIVTKYLKQHPKYWHLAADGLVLNALRQRFHAGNKYIQ